jgi:hypothetical protein
MISIIKEKVAMLTPKFEYPRFYIKEVGGMFTIIHRLTHTYVSVAHSEKEIVAEIKRLNSMDEKEFWTWFISEKSPKLPAAKNARQTSKDPAFDNEESWFHGAWHVFTDKFYSKYPKLLVEETELPMALIGEIRREVYKAERERTLKEEEIRRENERLYQEEVKEQARLEREKRNKVEMVPVGKIGSRRGIEKLAEKTRKAVKKLKVKNRRVSVELVDSSDPFA